MRYRRPNVHKYARSIEDYERPDKDALLEYMRARGFQRPLDVWLDNISAMLDVKMTVDPSWQDELQWRAFPPDATQFILNAKFFYLSFCMPSEPSDEYLMTENGYGIYEGPHSTTTDLLTGNIVRGLYTEYHIFAHTSPKLTMILRSFLLPLPEEDVDEDIKLMRERFQKINLSMHNFPERASSLLEDLPVTKAHNSYSRVVDGRIVLPREGHN